MSDLVARLLKLDTCAVSDASEALGLWGTVAGLSASSAPKRIAGVCVTVKLGPAGDDVPKRHLCSSAIEAAGPGEIIVVENHAREDAAGWGGLLSTAAGVRNIEGTIVDGPVRDADESAGVGYTVYGRSIVSSTARGRIAEHEFNTPVEIGGIQVAPGDLVLADGSGVVFIAAGSAQDVIAKAEDIAAREAAMAAAVRAGKPVGQVMGGDYEKMLIDGD